MAAEQTSEQSSNREAGGRETPPAASLSRRALQGESEAVDEMLQRYKDRVRRIVSIRFAGRLARLLLELMNVGQGCRALRYGSAGARSRAQ